MLRSGRQAQQDFTNDESLFFRWFTDWVQDGAIRHRNVPCPDQSVNRSKHGGNSYHVIIPEPQPKPHKVTESDANLQRRRRSLCMGIVRMTVADIPTDFVDPTGTFRFVLVHDPLEHNYCHCEIRVYRDGQRLSPAELDRSVGKKAKLHYRMELARTAKILLSPDTATGK